MTRKDNAISVVDPPKEPKGAYPICTFTWVIVPLQTAKAADLKQFVNWALDEGPDVRARRCSSCPLPKAVQTAAKKTIARVHS